MLYPVILAFYRDAQDNRCALLDTLDLHFGQPGTHTYAIDRSLQMHLSEQAEPPATFVKNLPTLLSGSLNFLHPIAVASVIRGGTVALNISFFMRWLCM